MKRCFSRYRLALFAMSLISSVTMADQIWRGQYGKTCVIDEDLVIKGDVLLPLGASRIEAIHKDVTITLSEDSIVRGHWAGASQIYLIAAEGRKITFVIDHDLTFVGSSHITAADLLMVQSGPGTVEVAIAEGKKFELTAQDRSGGVQYYVLMYGGPNAQIDEYCCDEYNLKPCDEYSCGSLFCGVDEYCGCEEYRTSGTGCNENSLSRPRLNFVNLEQFPYSSNKDRRIIVGCKSILSYLSSRKVGIGQDSGYINFDPVMTDLGRMILEIGNSGAFIVSGRYTCQRNGECIRLENIRPSIAAGYQAHWTVNNTIGSDVAAGLLILDKNETLSELLVDPFLNLHVRQDINNYRGLFSGSRYGLVLGSNGILNVGSDSYVDFVGLARNQTPCVAVPGAGSVQPNKLLKMRNPSAFTIDGNFNPAAVDAQILFGERSALFLRSGIADNGWIREDDVDPFTIDAADRTPGVGNIVFDLEGELNVNGVRVDGEVTSKIELLSLEVLPTGGSLFIGSGETNFPIRTFNTEDIDLLTYNCGAFFINNRMNLYDTALNHTDECHNVYQNNDLRSEPTYVGGETFKLLCSDARPNIRFINSEFNVHTDVALTGLDLVVPNYVDEFGILQANLSGFTFYSNGACVDNGTGRQMILGTRIGSTTANGCTRVDADAHLDVMEQDDAIGSNLNPENPNGNQTLDLLTAFNDATIVPDAETNVNSIHTIFLGGNSNISIGVNADSTGFNIDTNPWLRIAGSVFSFEARGGAATVARSLVSGKNAIFVDLNGEISIEPGFIANMGVMVIKSHNGIVNLPADQVFFNNGAGIATWDVDLSDPEDQVIVGPDQELSTYIFNWIRAKKDCPNFIPFSCCVDACACPDVTEANITSLPTIEGTIDDLQIQGTRIGDPAQFMIDGGYVRRLTFLEGSCSAEAPVATIVLKNDGRIGLDSTTTLGANGVTIIADGSGRAVINEDMIINNVCALVKGPNFESCDELELYSAVPREIRLKSGATLSLTSFDDASQIVSFGGELRLVVEPGAQIITGAGTLRFANNSQLLFEAADNAYSFFSAIPFGAQDSSLPITVVPAADPHNPLSLLTGFGDGLHNTDQFRVKLVGSGTIELVDDARGLLPFNAFVGVETISNDECEIATTDLTLSLADNGTFEIGHFNFNEGGVFQIGNVDRIEGHSVNFTLLLDGENANFSIGSRGFLGFGVGIERFDGELEVLRARNCPKYFVPNANIVNNLSNVDRITLRMFNGRIEHDRIFSGDEVDASLIAISGSEGVTFDLDFEIDGENVNPLLTRESNFNIAGGGNIVLVNIGFEGGIQPIVLDVAGELSTPVGVNLSAGVMASTLLQPDNVDVEFTGAEFFDYISTQDATDVTTTRDNTFGRANAASQGDSFKFATENIRVDTVVGDTIVRGKAFDIIGAGQEDAKNQAAIEDAAVFANINPTMQEIITVANIQL